MGNSHELAEIIVEAVILCYFLRHPFLHRRGTGEEHLLMVSVIRSPSENVDCDTWSVLVMCLGDVSIGTRAIFNLLRSLFVLTSSE